MASLIEIKKRIGSIASTIKVTKVMQMIATAKISKIKQIILVANRYEENANNFFDLYLKNSKFAEKLTEFTEKRPARKVLILFLASDKGTCGAINTTINKTLINVVKKYQKDNVAISIAPIGKKAFQFIQKEAGIIQKIKFIQEPIQKRFLKKRRLIEI